MAEARALFEAHELDAAWIIAVWKAIHGGDPGPEQIATQAIAALASVITGQAAALSAARLQAGLEPLGIKVTIEQAGAAGSQTEELTVAGNQPFHPPYCVRFQGQTICIYLPRPRGVLPQ